MEFGDRQGSGEETSSDEDNLSLADHANLMRAKRILRQQRERQGEVYCAYSMIKALIQYLWQNMFYIHMIIDSQIRCRS